MTDGQRLACVLGGALLILAGLSGSRRDEQLGKDLADLG